MGQIRILIADDHKLVREAWQQILNGDPRFLVIATCGDAEQAVQSAKVNRPDIVLMDICITPYSGLEATEKIKIVSPASKVIGVSFYTKPEYAKKLLQYGGSGYVTKNSSHEEMVEAILEVHGGKKYICSEIKNTISENIIENLLHEPVVVKISDREMQVIGFIKQGFTSRQIAEKLSITYKTVEAHRYNILRKLNLHSSTALVSFINSRFSFS